MRRIWLSFGVCAAVVVLLVLSVAVVMRIKGASMFSYFMPLPSPGEMYPAAPVMPAVVATPVEQLLTEYEAFLASASPAALAALQPGLTDGQIDALEQAHAIKLPPDLRALYRWRNGTPRGPGVGPMVFPDHPFIPLDVALADRVAYLAQVKALPADQRGAHAAFAGHRDGWVAVLVDVAGDGYFFDPGRTESQGSFFFCFAEDGSYVFFPAFRNYLAAVVEGQKDGVFVAGAQGIRTLDYVRSRALWDRFGATPPR